MKIPTPKVRISIVGTVLFVSPCYSEDQPTGYTNAAASAAARILQSAIGSADDVILYSLDPERADVIYRPGKHLSPEDLAKLFNGYRVLGQVRIEDAAERRALVDSLCKGLANAPS
jgi:hypothetical protein